MLEGRPHLLVVGAADTGRAPILAALLRQALGDDIIVTSAGVLGHTGEPADPYVQIVVDQLGASLFAHTARQLSSEISSTADQIVAVDRGTAAVLQARGMSNSVAISELAQAEDIPDPHHMPLGIWLTAAQSYRDQVKIATPAFRHRLGLNATPAVPRPTAPPPVPSAPTDSAAQPDSSARSDHVTQLLRMLDTVRLLPQIVDWARVVGETDERLQSLAAMTTDEQDYSPAAAAMLAGLLHQFTTTPEATRLDLAHKIAEGLTQPVDSETLLRLAGLAAQWSRPPEAQ